MDLSYVRSSHWKSSVKKDVLKNLRIFTEIYVYWSFFLTKLQVFRPLVGILLSWLLLITFITTKQICVFSSLSYQKLKELKNLSRFFLSFQIFRSCLCNLSLKAFALDNINSCPVVFIYLESFFSKIINIDYYTH